MSDPFLSYNPAIRHGWLFYSAKNEPRRTLPKHFIIVQTYNNYTKLFKKASHTGKPHFPLWETFSLYQ